MGDGHAHGVEVDPALERRAARAVRGLLLGLIVPLAVATVVGLVVLWPGKGQLRPPELAVGPDTKAEVISVRTGPCPEEAGPAGSTCRLAGIRITSGPNEGDRATLATDLDASTAFAPPELGDRIVVAGFDVGGTMSYQLVDVDRQRPLAVLAVVFALLVVALARRKGVAALVGLAVTLLVLVRFVLPAIIEGRDPVAVSVVGASVVLFAVFYLGFGVNVRSSTALAGTLLSLVVTGVLAVLFVGATSLTGAASEEALAVAATAGQINLRGLLLGGIIIGSLGVLNDVTITQASTVWQLRLADPSASSAVLFRRGMAVGRDHIGATVDTLVLAYAGASMPLLVYFTLADRGVADVLNSAPVAEEIVRSLVGAIGLVLSVPITTGLAAVLSSRADVVEAVSGDGR